MQSTSELRLSPKIVSTPSRTLHMMGEEIHIALRGEDTGGAFSIIEDLTPPAGGPPPHVHSLEDELFYVLEGQYELKVGEDLHRAGPGTCVFAPRGIPHAFRNVSDKPSRMMILFSPPGFERFFEDVDAAAAAGPPPFETIVALAASYGNHLVPAQA